MSQQINYEPQREFELVQYPGRVVNIERMLSTLGGLNQISKVLGDEQKRLDLRYHPDNPYNKPAFGESTNRSGVLLSVKVQRSKRHPTRPPKYFVRVLGHCSRVFGFESLCDFQYLPLYREPKPSQEGNEGLQIALKRLQPQDITDLDYFKHSDVPFLCLPELFSRVDLVYPGTYRNDAQDHGQHDVLGVNAKSSNDNRDVVSFNMTDPFPQRPDPQIIKRMKVKYVSDEQFLRVKKLFEQCPIWTRIALIYESGMLIDKLKCITPSLAYFFNTGPWRTLYVRYGYDPRKDFNSRYYQTFDFRLRFGSGVSEFVYCRKVSLKNKQSGNDEAQHDLVQDINYPYFDEHKLPRSRQCILRYCDVRMEKIQDMLEKIPSPMTGAKCNEVTGWLPLGFDAQVRIIVCNTIKELLRSHYRKEHLTAEVEAVDQAATGDDDEEAEDEEINEETQDDDGTYLDETNVSNIMDKNIENLFNTMTSEH